MRPGSQAIALPETDAGGGTWQLADSGAADALAQVTRCSPVGANAVHCGCTSCRQHEVCRGHATSHGRRAHTEAVCHRASLLCQWGEITWSKQELTCTPGCNKDHAALSRFRYVGPSSKIEGSHSFSGPHRREGHETAHCSLAISVPAATQLRQVAALHALAAECPGAAWLGDVAAANAKLLDVKGALRHALSPQLGRALGWQVRQVPNPDSQGP